MPYFWHFEPNTRIVSHLRIWTLHSQPILLHHHFVAQYLNVITYILYTRFQLRFRIDHVYGYFLVITSQPPTRMLGLLGQNCRTDALSYNYCLIIEAVNHHTELAFSSFSRKCILAPRRTPPSPHTRTLYHRAQYLPLYR